MPATVTYQIGPEPSPAPPACCVLNGMVLQQTHGIAAGVLALALAVIGAPIVTFESLASHRVQMAASRAADPEVRWKPFCTEPRANVASPRVQATGKIRKLGADFEDSYAGVRRCDHPKRIVVFRIPDAVFDKSAKRIASRHDVRLELREAPFSHSGWRIISQQAFNRNPELLEHGASVQTTSFTPEGNVWIGIDGDMAAARRILKDLDDQAGVELYVSGPVRSM